MTLNGSGDLFTRFKDKLSHREEEKTTEIKALAKVVSTSYKKYLFSRDLPVMYISRSLRNFSALVNVLREQYPDILTPYRL